MAPVPVVLRQCAAPIGVTASNPAVPVPGLSGSRPRGPAAAVQCGVPAAIGDLDSSPAPRTATSTERCVWSTDCKRRVRVTDASGSDSGLAVRLLPQANLRAAARARPGNRRKSRRISPARPEIRLGLGRLRFRPLAAALDRGPALSAALSLSACRQLCVPSRPVRVRLGVRALQVRFAGGMQSYLLAQQHAGAGVQASGLR